ncbi:hypothetical protein GCM10023339_38410 [Alloalcanivorax gelatiniphagus]
MDFLIVMKKLDSPVIKPATHSGDRLLYFALVKLFDISTGVISGKASFNPRVNLD